MTIKYAPELLNWMLYYLWEHLCCPHVGRVKVFLFISYMLLLGDKVFGRRARVIFSLGMRLDTAFFRSQERVVRNFFHHSSRGGAQSIGVCYGMDGDNLPTPQQVVNLYKSRNIERTRLYYPNQAALQALRGSGIQVILGAPNPDLQRLATNTSFANNWVQTNMEFGWDVKYRYIAVGNEVIPGNNAQYVLPAMRNIYNAIQSVGLQDQIKVSTSVATSVLGTSYPPTHGSFTPEASSSLGPIISYLASIQAPLLVNVHPYFSYRDNPNTISLPYALFTANSVVVTDGQYQYGNLFDALVDAMYSAMEKTGGSNVPIVVSESGWLSNGGNAATVENAQTYNSNLIRHVAQGTPKRPGALEAYIFATFNENKKGGPEIERNFGLFHPNQQPVYQVNFT